MSVRHWRFLPLSPVAVVLAAGVVFSPNLWAAVCDQLQETQKLVAQLTDDLQLYEVVFKDASESHKVAIAAQKAYQQSPERAQARQALDEARRKAGKAWDALVKATERRRSARAELSVIYDSQVTLVSEHDKARVAYDAGQKVTAHLAGEMAKDPKLQEVIKRKSTAEQYLAAAVGISYLTGLSDSNQDGLDRLDMALKQVEAGLSRDVLDGGRFHGDYGSQLAQKQDELADKEREYEYVKGDRDQRHRLTAEIAELKKGITGIAATAQQQSTALRGIWNDGDLAAAEFTVRDKLSESEKKTLIGLDVTALKRAYDRAKANLDRANAREAQLNAELAGLEIDIEGLTRQASEAKLELATAEEAFQKASDKKRELNNKVGDELAILTKARAAIDKATVELTTAKDRVVKLTLQLETINAEVTSRAASGKGSLSAAFQAGAAGDSNACMSSLATGRQELQAAAGLIAANMACFTGPAAQTVFKNINAEIVKAEAVDCGGRKLTPTIMMPDVVGNGNTDAQAARQRLVGVGLKPTLVAILQPTTRAEAGKVVSQTPAAGMHVEAGELVIVSHYDVLRQVPSGLRGRPYQEADTTLGLHGLFGAPVKGTPAPPGKKEGDVYLVAPSEGSWVLPTTSITITYHAKPDDPGEGKGNPFDTAADGGAGPGSGVPSAGGTDGKPGETAGGLDPGPLLDQADSALQRCDYASAASALSQAAAIDPAHPRLAPLYADRDRRLAAEQQVLNLLNQATAVADVMQQVGILQQAQQAAPCPKPQMNTVTSQIIAKSAGAERTERDERNRARRDAAGSILDALIAAQNAIIRDSNTGGAGSGGSVTPGGGVTDGATGASCSVSEQSYAYAWPDATMAHLVCRIDPTDPRAPVKEGYVILTVPTRIEGTGRALCTSARGCLAHIWTGDVAPPVLSEHSSISAARDAVRKLCSNPTTWKRW